VVPPVAALALAGAVALLAWRTGSLSGGGAAAGWLVGSLVLVGTGWAGGAVLAAFFVSSSAVGRGERRDQRQVVANGGPAALGALLGLQHPVLGLWIVTGSLAGAAADTWATAIGTRSRTPPRNFLLGRRVYPGTSGGMTPLGCAGAAAGALLVAATGAAVGSAPALLPLGTMVGFVGMLADSALGFAWQGRFHCPACGEPSEWRVHRRCGTPTEWQGGARWLDNDGVNLGATSLAAVLAGLAWLACCR
jgi:uncharacterized membrane protein